MLTQLKIAHKIYLMSAIQLLLIFIIAWIGISQMAKIGDEIADITNNNIPLSNGTTLLTEHKLTQAIFFERTILEGTLKRQGVAEAEARFSNAYRKFNALSTKIDSEIKSLENFIEEAIPALHSPIAIEEYQKLLKGFQNIETDYSKLKKESVSVIGELDQGDLAAALKAAHSVEKHADQLDHSIEDILHEIQNFTFNAAIQAKQDEEAGLTKIIIGFIVSLVISLIIPFAIGRSITSPINRLTHRLHEIAHGDGDLTLRLNDEARDETGDAARSFNTFMEKLGKTIKQINLSADQLGKSSETAIFVLDKTLSNIQKQRDETLMVSNAMDEMRTATQHVAQNTAEAAKVAESAKNRVTQGKAAAIDTQTIIKQLASEVSNASSVIESLATETDNIGNVLEAIRGIAEQTNLLALNAAIEAARAGDTGRGFAVVADEVRSLAQRTQSSTGDIQKLVESLQSEAKNAVLSMQKGSSSTEKCLEKSAETAEALEDASQAVNSISDLNTQIASTAEEQSAAAEQIKGNVHNISNIAEEASKGSAETASANQTIARGVIDLHTALNQFHV
jgi:methyl-accepting chemotaxis protein